MPEPKPGVLTTYIGDRSACNNSSCSLAHKCFRFLGKRGKCQAFACYRSNEQDGCFLGLYPNELEQLKENNDER